MVVSLDHKCKLYAAAGKNGQKKSGRKQPDHDDDGKA